MRDQVNAQNPEAGGREDPWTADVEKHPRQNEGGSERKRERPGREIACGNTKSPDERKTGEKPVGPPFAERENQSNQTAGGKGGEKGTRESNVPARRHADARKKQQPDE